MRQKNTEREHGNTFKGKNLHGKYKEKVRLKQRAIGANFKDTVSKRKQCECTTSLRARTWRFIFFLQTFYHDIQNASQLNCNDQPLHGNLILGP